MEPTSGDCTPQEAAGEAGKLVGDASWKEEAQREKERLQKSTEQDPGAGGPEGELPAPTFFSFISELGLQAMLALGLAEIRGGAGPKRDLPLARYTIDLLGMIQEKTRGNLGPEEKQHLGELLQSLRFGFVRSAQAAEAETKKVVEPPEKKIIV